MRGDRRHSHVESVAAALACRTASRARPARCGVRDRRRRRRLDGRDADPSRSIMARARVGSVSSRTGGAGGRPGPQRRDRGCRRASGSRSWTTTISGLPQKLRRQLDAARAEDAELVYSGAIMLDRRGGHQRSTLPEPESISYGHAPLPERRPAGCSNVMVTRELLARHGGFDEHLYQLADWDLWLRLALDASDCEHALSPSSAMRHTRRTWSSRRVPTSCANSTTSS